MDEIRSWWEVPSIAHFCSLFRTAFDLTDFDIEDLEDALLETEKEEGSAFLLDLICRLLNGCYARKDITVANYDLYVKDIVKYKWGTTDNPVKDKSEFQELTLREKVEFIYAVCEYRLDTEDVSDVIKGFDGDSMRVEPLGKDKDGALYWYFYGSRLYMEDAEPRKTLTKEEKRALEREKRIAAKKKKEEEKRQKKEEKKKLKALKKNDKKKQIEQAAKNQKAEGTNTRRSGRLRNKKIVVEESESSESSSSSSEEEELVDSSSEEEEEEEEEEIVEKTPAKCRGKAKKTSAKSTGKKTNKKTPAKKETPPKPTRSSTRKSKTTKKMEESRASQPERSTRRSLNSRNKPEPPPTPSAYDSETEEDNDFDVDSGHESAGSVRSEMSKTSQRISVAGRRTSRRPTANVDLKRDPSNVNDEDDYNDDEDSKGGANFTVDDAGSDSVKDGVKAVNKDEATDENKKNDQSVEAETKDKTDSIEEKGVVEQEAVENCNNSNNINHVNVAEDLNQETTGHDAPLVKNAEQNDVASTDKVKNNQGQSKENGNSDIEKTEDIDKTDTDETMAEDDVEGREVTPDNEGDTGKGSGNDSEKTEANIDADTKSGDVKVKTESNNIKDVTDDSNQTIPESEPMEVDDEGSQGNTRELRKRMKAEPVEIKKESEDNKTDDVNKFTLDKPAVAPIPSKSVTRWHLVCATLDDWVNLAEWFKESTVRCEKALSKEIRENFLPVLPEIIQAREKEITRKLMQEQDLRRSNRLTLKQREKLEQEKILAEALAEEEKARIQADEDRRLKEEQLRLEDENRQREERRKAREERAARLSMREERARLIAEGKEIPPELIYTGTGTQKYKDDDDSDDSRCDLKDEEDYAALMKVINAMKYHKDCWPFLEPVTDEVAPGYSDIIKRPMDLSKIEEKVENRDYRSRQHFLSDFRLMFNNCKRYNGQDSDFSDCARSMEIMLKKYIKRFVTAESTDKYYNDEDFMVAGGKGRLPVGEKRYRPKRAASSKAIETVHKALNSSEEETSSSDEDDKVQYKRRRESNINQSPFKVQSHHDLLLEELKRQREKKLAASALQNHKIITRGPERIRVPNPAGGGVMIIPKSEMNSSGVLRMAATREIKRKVNPQYPQKGHVVHTINPARKDFGMNIIDQTTPGSSQPKTIRIVASSGTGQGSVKQTAENVKVSADGYLIISGKNSGIKVTENTKIVIQPPGAQQQGSSGSQSPVAQSPVTVGGGGTPDFSQLAGASKTSTPRPNPGSSGLKSAQTSSETSGNASPASGPLSLSNLLRQVTGSQILSAHDQSRLQALVRQFASDANLTPEKAKTIDVARKILQLNLHKRKMLQQKTESEVNTPKIPRLESQTSEDSGSSIEQRLRDPSVNIDNQLGSVSKNVISNVNIASDILDTYYSVMNEAKTKPSVGSSPVTTVSRPSATVTQATAVTMPNSVTLSSPKCQSTVSSTTGPVTTSSTVTSSASKPTASHGSISDMTRLIINLMNKGDSGGGVNSAVLRPPPSTVNTALTQSVTDTPIARTQQSGATPVVAGCTPVVAGPTSVVCGPAPVVDGCSPGIGGPTVVVSGSTPVVAGSTPVIDSPTLAAAGGSSVSNNILTNTFPAMNASGLSGITSSSSVSDLLRSASAQHTSPPKNNDVTPIEALFMSNTSVKSNPVSVSKSSIVEALTCSLPGSNVDQMADQSISNPSVLTSSEKNERLNLFDSFENRSSCSKQLVSTNEFSSISNTDEKTIRMKLRADKMPLPSSSTVNFGSPLKTTSVLEALKCKLHTLKPDVQGNEGSDVTCTCMGLTLCSELTGDGSDACIYDPHTAHSHTARSQSPVSCVTSQHLVPYNPTISSSYCIHSTCASCHATVNDSCNYEQPSPCACGHATVNDSCNYEQPSPCACGHATVNDSCNCEQPSPCACGHATMNDSCNYEQPLPCACRHATLNTSCNELRSKCASHHMALNDSCNYEQPSPCTCHHGSVSDLCNERLDHSKDYNSSDHSTVKSDSIAAPRVIEMENNCNKNKDKVQSELQLDECTPEPTGAIDLSMNGLKGKYALDSTNDTTGRMDTFHNVGARSTVQNMNETNENAADIGSAKHRRDSVYDSNNNSEVNDDGLTPVLNTSRSSALKGERSLEEEDEQPDCECFEMELHTLSLSTEGECLCSQDSAEQMENQQHGIEIENHTMVDNKEIPAGEKNDLSPLRYACKLSTKRLTDSVLKVSVDVKEFHFQKNEPIQISEEEKPPLLNSTKLKDYIIQRPNLKQKKSPMPDSHVFLNSPQLHWQTNSYTYCTSPRIPGQIIAHSYLGSPPNQEETNCPTYSNSPQISKQHKSDSHCSSPQMHRQANSGLLSSPVLMQQTCDTLQNRTQKTQKTIRSGSDEDNRSIKKNNRFYQLCDTVKMYKICSIKPRSSPEVPLSDVQQNGGSSSISNTYQNQVCGKNRMARKKLNMPIPSSRPLGKVNKSVWTTKEQLIEEYQQGKMAELTPVTEHQYMEHGILGDAENEAFYSSISSNSEPFISPAIHTHADSFIDSSLVPSVDFHSLSPNTFISNIFTGDGNDIDHDFAKIENDIFELQEKYPAPLPSSSTNVLQPACDLGLKPSSDSPFNDKRITSLVSSAGFLNTSGIGGSSVVMPSSAVTSIHHQVTSPSVQTVSLTQQHSSSSNTSTTSLDYGVYDSAILNQVSLPGNQLTSLHSETGNQTIGLAIPTIKVIPQPTSFTVDFSKLEGINRGMNAPVQNVPSPATNPNNSTIIGAPAAITNQAAMMTQIEQMDTSLPASDIISDNQSM